MIPGIEALWGYAGAATTSIGTGLATTTKPGGLGLFGCLAMTNEFNSDIHGFHAPAAGWARSMQT
jgi:hypothetical protein